MKNNFYCYLIKINERFVIMTATENIDQHLEMLIQKRNRCEDWVASVTLQENIRKPKGEKLLFTNAFIKFILLNFLQFKYLK